MAQMIVQPDFDLSEGREAVRSKLHAAAALAAASRYYEKTAVEVRPEQFWVTTQVWVEEQLEQVDWEARGTLWIDWTKFDVGPKDDSQATG